MNIPIDIPNNIYGWFAVGAFIVAAILFIRKSDIKAIKENATDLRNILEDKEKEILVLRQELHQLRDELAKLRLSLEEKDKRINTLSKIEVVQKPNPEQIAYMADMLNFVTVVRQYMMESSKTLTELNVKTAR